MHVVAKRVSKAITSIYIELIDYRATDNKATFRFRNKQTSKKKKHKSLEKINRNTKTTTAAGGITQNYETICNAFLPQLQLNYRSSTRN